MAGADEASTPLPLDAFMEAVIEPWLSQYYSEDETVGNFRQDALTPLKRMWQQRQTSGEKVKADTEAEDFWVQLIVDIEGGEASILASTSYGNMNKPTNFIKQDLTPAITNVLSRGNGEWVINFALKNQHYTLEVGKEQGVGQGADQARREAFADFCR